MEIIIGRYYYGKNEALSWIILPDYILTLLLVGIVILMFLQYAKRKDSMGALFGALPLMALVGYVSAKTSVVFSMFLFNVFLFVVSVTRIMFGIRTNKLGVINTGMFMLAALILARFFDSEINFVIKGMVFIFIGIGFLVTNAVILRRKGGAS